MQAIETVTLLQGSTETLRPDMPELLTVPGVLLTVFLCAEAVLYISRKAKSFSGFFDVFEASSANPIREKIRLCERSRKLPSAYGPRPSNTLMHAAFSAATQISFGEKERKETRTETERKKGNRKEERKTENDSPSLEQIWSQHCF